MEILGCNAQDVQEHVLLRGGSWGWAASRRTAPITPSSEGTGAGVVLPWKGMAETLRQAVAKSTVPRDNLRCYFSTFLSGDSS